MHYSYRCKGTCAMAIELDLDEEKKLHNVIFHGGCDGNHKGIEKLVVGMKAEDIISRIEGVSCGFRATSCPDQLAKALRKALEE